MAIHSRSSHSPPQWGHQKWEGEKENGCTVGRAASGLVHTHPIGVSHFWEQQGHHLVFIVNKETISHAGLESHTKGGILSTHKRRTHHKGRQIMKLPNSRRLKIKATTKLSGATSTWVRQSHYFRPTYTQTT